MSYIFHISVCALSSKYVCYIFGAEIVTFLNDVTTCVALFGLCVLHHIHPFTWFYSVCSILCC